MSEQPRVSGPAGQSPHLSRDQLLTLAGCALFGVSTLLPVMRWLESSVHSTAGSARVFGGDDFTLVDGGFGGEQLLPVAAIGVVLVAVAVLASRLGTWVWRAQVVALAVALYYPGWVLYAFARKIEDQVFPAEGVVVLVLAFAAMATGTYRSAPRHARTSRFDVATD